MTVMDKKKNNLIEWGILGLYTILYIAVTIFHEPWFDEAQAWEIAKCGSYHDLLFLIPHGEGHPPLWSLILSIPAKLGVPYEIGLKGVAFIFSVLTAYLLIFRAPFKKWIRYTLPFTYFFFYQYGIISRTYCVVVFLLLLLADWFMTKDEHPYRFAAALVFLCASSAYGIAIAGGICICWSIDIWIEKKNEVSISNLKTLFFDKRIKALLLVLIFAVLFIVEILPYKATAAINSSRHEFLAKKILYMFFAMQGDAFMSPIFPEIWEKVNFMILASGILTTMISWAYLCAILPKNKWKYYFVPECFFALLMTYYGHQHHSGVCVAIYIAAIWASYGATSKEKQITTLREKIAGESGTWMAAVFNAIPAISIATMLLFSVMSSQKDIVYLYSDGREMANFIKEHHMEDALIMVQWEPSQHARNDEDCECTIEDYDTNAVGDAVTLIPYFDKNIVFNHNDNKKNIGYITHFVASMEENLDAYARWKKYGYPEVIIGSPHIEYVYNDEISYSDYTIVLKTQNRPVWKGSTDFMVTRVYVRNDCLEKFGL